MTKYEWEKELRKNLKRLPDTEVVRALDYYNEAFFDKEESGMSEREIIRSFGNPFDVAYRIVYGFEGAAQNSFFGAGGMAATNLNTQSGGSFCTETGVYIEADKKAEKRTDEIYDDWGNSEQFETPFTTPNPITNPTPNATPHTTVNLTPNSQKQKKSGTIARILFFLPYTILMIVLWSLVVGFVAGGIGAALGGIVAVIAGLTHFVQIAAGTAQTAGIGITLLGGGLAAFGVGLVIIAFAISIIKLAVKTTQKYFFIGKHKTGKRNEAHELQYHSNKQNEPVGGTQSW